MSNSIVLSSVVALAQKGLKLSKFCHIVFPSLSKKEVHEAFKAKRVSVNGLNVGETDETRKVNEGDVIRLEHVKIVDVEKLFGVIHEGNRIAILSKPAGVATRAGGLLDTLAKATLWNNAFPLTADFLFRPMKSQHALCMLAEDSLTLSLLRKFLCLGSLRLVFICICTGIIGQPSSSIQLPSPVANSLIDIKIISTSHSRSAGMLSLIEVTPRFEFSQMADCSLLETGGATSRANNRCVAVKSDDDEDTDSCEEEAVRKTVSNAHYPTVCIRQIKHVLSRAGHAIVGDGDIVKSSKGLFCSLTRIEMDSKCFSYLDARDYDDDNFVKHIGMCSDAQLRVERESMIWSIPVPLKFQKVLEREEATYNKAIHERDCKLKDQNIQSASVKEDYPLEYITKSADFCGRTFSVDERVMIPRPASEVLVDVAIDYCRSLLQSSSRASILDLGTGSGCLLLSTLGRCRELFPDLDVKGVGLDISADALAVAAYNARQLGLDAGVEFRIGSFIDLSSVTEAYLAIARQGMIPIEASSNVCVSDACLRSRRGFNIVVCNPPYSSLKDSRKRLFHSRMSYEPTIALCTDDGGPLSAYQKIASMINASRGQDSTFAEDCRFIFEVGSDQDEKVRQIFAAVSSLLYLQTACDQYGMKRCLIFKYILNAG